MNKEKVQLLLDKLLLVELGANNGANLFNDVECDYMIRLIEKNNERLGLE